MTNMTKDREGELLFMYKAFWIFPILHNLVSHVH